MDRNTNKLPEDGKNSIYAHIAQALARGYTDLYCVNLEPVITLNTTLTISSVCSTRQGVTRVFSLPARGKLACSCTLRTGRLS